MLGVLHGWSSTRVHDFAHNAKLPHLLSGRLSRAGSRSEVISVLATKPTPPAFAEGGDGRFRRNFMDNSLAGGQRPSSRCAAVILAACVLVVTRPNPNSGLAPSSGRIQTQASDLVYGLDTHIER